jgi:hypothetical protein
MANENKGPLAKHKAGGCVVSIWESEANINGQTRSMLRASVERRYRDSSGTWRSSTSFSRNEIPLLQLALSRAFEQMVGERSISGGKTEEIEA